MPSLPARIRHGEDRRILFTYDRFAGVESLPQPGPVYVHAEACERYSEHAGFPEELRESPRTVEAYAHGRRLLAQEYVADERCPGDSGSLPYSQSPSIAALYFFSS